MSEPLLRDAAAADFPALLRLNAESERFLSPLDEARLRHLHEQAAWHRAVVQDGTVVAFLLALREGADYASPNYQWFAARYPRFLYIDRVVVSAAHQGRGHGALLYADVLAFARRSGAERVVCEFDLEPPNAASRHFHARFGFREVGTQMVAGGAKRVSLQERLADAAGGVPS